MFAPAAGAKGATRLRPENFLKKFCKIRAQRAQVFSGPYRGNVSLTRRKPPRKRHKVMPRAKARAAVTGRATRALPLPIPVAYGRKRRRNKLRLFIFGQTTPEKLTYSVVAPLSHNVHCVGTSREPCDLRQSRRQKNLVSEPHTRKD